MKFRFKYLNGRFPKIFLVFLLVLVGLFLIYPTVNAAGLVPCGRLQDDPSTTDVNETNPCTTCDIFALGSRVINFVLFTIVPAVAVLCYLIGGLMILLGGAKPGLIATGKNFFWNTTRGLVIIFGAWMITNTVLKSLAGNRIFTEDWNKVICIEPGGQVPPGTVQKYSCTNNQCAADTNGQYSDSNCGGNCTPAQKFYICDENDQCVEDPQGNAADDYTTSNCDNECQATGAPLTITTSSLSDGTVDQSYTQPINVSGGASPYIFSITTGNLPPGLSLSAGGIVTGTPTTANTYTFAVKVEDSTTPTKQSASKELSIKVNTTAALQCPDVGNLCEPSSTSCLANACGQYSTAINQAAAKISITGVNSSSVIRSIMFGESTCEVSAYNSTKDPNTGRLIESCGLMQMQPETADRFDTRCRVPDKSVNCSFLRNPANINAIVCLGAMYIQSIANGTCGNQVRNIAAGYNAGIGNCVTDPECASSKSCDGGAVRKWECPYDRVDNKLVCNTRLNETRTYAPKILACYNNQ